MLKAIASKGVYLSAMRKSAAFVVLMTFVATSSFALPCPSKCCLQAGSANSRRTPRAHHENDLLGAECPAHALQHSHQQLRRRASGRRYVGSQELPSFRSAIRSMDCETPTLPALLRSIEDSGRESMENLTMGQTQGNICEGTVSTQVGSPPHTGTFILLGSPLQESPLRV